MVDFEKQAARMGADIRYGLATAVDLSSQPYKVEIDEEKTITADAIIIATGASAKWLGLPSEQRAERQQRFRLRRCVRRVLLPRERSRHRGRGRYCGGKKRSTSPGSAPTLHMLVRRHEMRASKPMQDRVLKTSNYHGILEHRNLEVTGENKVEGVRILNTQTKEEKQYLSTHFSLPSATQPNSGILQASWKWTTRVISKPSPVAPERAMEGVLPVATCRTRSTARLANGSAAAAVWPRWMRKGTCQPKDINITGRFKESFARCVTFQIGPLSFIYNWR